MNDELGPMLTVREVAHLLHVHSNTVRRWSDRGLLKAYRITSRGDRRFRKEDVLRFLEEQNNNKPTNNIAC
ncbi:MAG: helix-turn-helix domain-containing protein [Dehalococcoidales bacterium]|jgi:excisionase family DNA binding protein|nr:helix-turn-helix domain-containing protein [Dehalococcoidales bacterium]